MSGSPKGEEWQNEYADLRRDAEEVFSNEAISAVAKQRLSNHGGYTPERIRKNSSKVFELRNARRIRLALRRGQEA